VAEELAGKIAIVTGGASGIGRAAVELFVREGARVVIADIDSERGEQLAADIGEAAAFRPCNVADGGDVQALVDFAVGRFGGLHVMYNNAGYSGISHGTFAADDLRDFQQVMAVNLYGVMLGSQAAARHMAAHGGGSIINTGSVAGSLPGYGQTAYRAAKAGVNHFTKCIAIEYGAHCIRANCINPSGIPTGMMGDAAVAVMLEVQPLKRRAAVADVANIALFLASDRSVHVTGQSIAVDGGHSIGDSINYVDRIMALGADVMGNAPAS
jgi:NAD(P)-dependent dehydrogenase (short-subunit alcohol dehydrogenase family)